MKVYEFSSLEEYFIKYIDVLSVLEVSEANFLTNKEKKFLVSFMVSEYKGIDINSERGVLFVKEHSECKHKDYYSLKKKLEDKGWLLKIEDGNKLPNILDANTNKQLCKKINFNFTLNGEIKRENKIE